MLTRRHRTLLMTLALLLAATTGSLLAGGCSNGGDDSGVSTSGDDGTVSANPGQKSAAIVLSRIDPGASITLYNAGSEEFDLAIGGADFQFCVRPSYAAVVGDSAPTIAAQSAVDIPWPAELTSDGARELALYRSSVFNSTEAIIDFVCWDGGAEAGASRKATAEQAERPNSVLPLWTGDCMGARGDSAIELINADGGPGADAEAYSFVD